MLTLELLIVIFHQLHLDSTLQKANNHCDLFISFHPFALIFSLKHMSEETFYIYPLLEETLVWSVASTWPLASIPFPLCVLSAASSHHNFHLKVAYMKLVAALHCVASSSYPRSRILPYSIHKDWPEHYLFAPQEEHLQPVSHNVKISSLIPKYLSHIDSNMKGLPLTITGATFLQWTQLHNDLIKDQILLLIFLASLFFNRPQMFVEKLIL